MLRKSLIAVLTAACLTACTTQPSDGQARAAHPFNGGRWVDLSHDFSESTLYWPTADRFKLTVEFHGKTDKDFHYEANHYSASEHGGTHLDAPAHFAQGRKTVDQLTLEQLSGPAIVVDVRAAVASSVDYQVTTADLLNWESRYGQIPAGAIVLLNTGFASRWPDAARYLGTAERGPDAVPKLHFPGLSPDAARWLSTQRSIKAIGLDTASIDYGQSTHFESHRILFERDIPAFENVASLDALPPTGTFLIAAPMKIKGGSGAPLRLIAWIRQ